MWKLLHRTALPLAFLALAFSIAGTAQEPRTAAQLPTVRLELPLEAFEEARQEWYGIYADDNKLGYLKNTIRFEPSDGGRFTVENEMHLKVVTLGQRREVRSVESFSFDGTDPYRLLHGHSVIDQGPYRQEVELTAREGAYEARILAADSERTLDVPDPDYTVADMLTPELWFRQRREPGERLTTRSFSLSDLTPAVDTYSVRSLKNTLVDGVPVSYYEVDLHSSAAGSIGTALIDLEGTLVSGVIGGAFELRMESAELAQDFDYSADVYLLGMAEIDEPLGDPRTIDRLLLEVQGHHADKIPTSARQRLSYDDDTGVWQLAIGSMVEGDAAPATAEAIAAALEESVEHPIYETEIVELALEAVGDVSSPAGQVEALVRFVDRYLTDSYSAEPLTVLDMLTTRKGDCTEHALLFTTLARSIGLPTREVTGLLYLGDDVRAFGGHAWNEVALDGYWHPVDATWGEMDINATHILLGPRIGEEASAEALFGGYSFKLLEVERTSGP